MTTKSKMCKKFIALFVTFAMIFSLIPASIAYADAQCKLTVEMGEEEGMEAVILEWSKVQGGFFYRIYRAVDKDGEPGTFKNISSVYAEEYTSSRGDINFKPGQTYYYKMVISDGDWEEEGEVICESNTVKITVPLKKPEVEGYTDIATGDPYLTWDSVKGASKYQVWRATSKSGTYKKLITTTKKTYTDTKASSSGKAFYYKIVAVSDVSSKANSTSNIVSVKSVKADAALAKAVKNTSKKKVSTLDNTLSLVKKVGIQRLDGFDGGLYDVVEGDLKLNEVYDFSKIKKAGATVKKTSGGLGDPYYSQMVVYPQKDDVKYKKFRITTYGVNIHKVKKNSTQKECIASIKKTAQKYYPSSSWTVTVEKYNSKKAKKQIKGMTEVYNYYLEKSGYGKYESNKYVLTIKNKSNSKKTSWAFVTIVPTL